jgi:hypothetical protein
LNKELIEHHQATFKDERERGLIQKRAEWVFSGAELGSQLPCSQWLLNLRSSCRKDEKEPL